jgi:hypothetical protein
MLLASSGVVDSAVMTRCLRVLIAPGDGIE